MPAKAENLSTLETDPIKTDGGESPGDGHGAKQYWSGNLDPLNLEPKRRSKRTLCLEDEIAFASAPDVAEARQWIAQGPGGPILDLGAGMGAISFHFARHGFSVICLDSSLERLRALRRRSVEAGCAESIVALAADAQALPFSDEALSSVFTKSVLIHTDLAGTAREISRVLKPDGRAAFIEPQKANPFAWIYRRTLAPKSWRAITRYFDAEAQQTCIKLIGEGSVRPFYLFSFLAFAFQFAWPNVGRFFGTLRFLHKIDQWLFSRLRWTRSLAWFGVIEVKKRSQKDKEKR